MSEEHTDNLKKARARLIEQRRAFVKVLAGPYERGKTEQAREKFLEMQTVIEAMNRAQPIEVPFRGGVVLIHPKGPAYSAMKVKNVEPAGATGSRSMPKSRGRKPKKPRAPTKGAPKQLIAHNTPPREPPIPAQTVQQEPSISPQTVQQESSIPQQTLLQSILKSVKRAWVLLVTQRGSFT
jgi:hypothetical protein